MTIYHLHSPDDPSYRLLQVYQHLEQITDVAPYISCPLLIPVIGDIEIR